MDQGELVKKREALLREAERNGTLKCIVCGKTPPGTFMCHFSMLPTSQDINYFFSCNSTLCVNRLKAELSRPEKGNVGFGLQSGRKMFGEGPESRPIAHADCPNCKKVIPDTDAPNTVHILATRPKDLMYLVADSIDCGEKIISDLKAKGYKIEKILR